MLGGKAKEKLQHRWGVREVLGLRPGSARENRQWEWGRAEMWRRGWCAGKEGRQHVCVGWGLGRRGSDLGKGIFQDPETLVLPS